MKHLRKYNEGKEEIIDKEYLDNCFIEFMDNKLANPGIINRNNGIYRINILYPFMPEITSDLTDLSILKKHNDDVRELYLEVENCIDKVKIEYNNINVMYEVMYVNSIDDEDCKDCKEVHSLEIKLKL